MKHLYAVVLAVLFVPFAAQADGFPAAIDADIRLGMTTADLKAQCPDLGQSAEMDGLAVYEATGKCHDLMMGGGKTRYLFRADALVLVASGSKTTTRWNASHLMIGAMNAGCAALMKVPLTKPGKPAVKCRNHKYQLEGGIANESLFGLSVSAFFYVADAKAGLPDDINDSFIRNLKSVRKTQ